MPSDLRHTAKTAQNAPLPIDDRSYYQADIARDLADRLARGGQQSSASIRSALICHPSRSAFWNPSDNADLGPTPLSRILGTGGGRGGANRLRLLLTLLWVAKRPPFDVRDKLTYAWIIGLDPRLTDDQRTISRNITWLIDHGFLRHPTPIDATDRPILLEETLRGRDYTPPPRSDGWNADDEEKRYHFYFRLPAHFFTSGLITRLSAAELACLLVYLDERRRRKLNPETGEPTRSIEWSEKEWKARYSLSDDTRQRGFKGLVHPHKVLGRTRGRMIPSLDNPLGTRPSYILLDRALDGRTVPDETFSE